MISYKQLSLADIFEDCQNIFEDDKPQFLVLLEQHINLDEIIPLSFYNHFYASMGRIRIYPLTALLWALILQKIFSVPTDQLLLTFLQYSKPLRDFCGFTKVPDASKITRFKQDFETDIKNLFEHLVDVTEPICKSIDEAKSDMLLFDTSGIEAWVTENNPKFANRIIRQLKAYAKTLDGNSNYDPYKAAYGSMPSHAAANPAIQQMYINGHFCYSYKFGILTNGLGIVRHISFYNKDFLDSHPEIIVEKKDKSPDEDKSLADAKALIPTLDDFFKKHPLINPSTFLGDSAFDSISIYKYLLEDCCFKKAYIPLKNKLSVPGVDYKTDENGIPCCPKNDLLPMKREGSKSHLRCGVPTMKFVCPKMKWTWDKEQKRSYRKCECDNPCTTSSCGRMIYVYPEQNLRAYPGTIRGTKEWETTYKIRVNVEKSINHIKDSFCLANRKTRDAKTLHSDLLIAGIAQLITVVLADKIHHHEYIRSLKPLIV